MQQLIWFQVSQLTTNQPLSSSLYSIVYTNLLGKLLELEVCDSLLGSSSGRGRLKKGQGGRRRRRPFTVWRSQSKQNRRRTEEEVGPCRSMYYQTSGGNVDFHVLLWHVYGNSLLKQQQQQIVPRQQNANFCLGLFWFMITYYGLL